MCVLALLYDGDAADDDGNDNDDDTLIINTQQNALPHVRSGFTIW